MRRSTFLSALMAMVVVALSAPALAAANADLAVTISDSPDPVDAGSNITYSVTAQNVGDQDAANVGVAFAVPAQTTFVSATAPGGWACPNVAGTITCTNSPMTAGAASVVMTFVVKTDASLTAGSTINATVNGTTASAENDTANNSASTTTTTSTAPAPPAPSTPPLRPRPVPTWGISPSHGPVTGGTAVTIQGIKFGGVTQVRFGDTPALFTVDNFNQITAIVPPHAAGTVPITMLRGVWSNPDEWMMFTYEPVAVGPQPVVPHEPAPGRSCVVPDLHRHTLHGARLLLARAGCSLGHVTRAKPRKGASRVRVARQSAPAGKRLAQRSSVAVVLRALR